MALPPDVFLVPRVQCARIDLRRALREERIVNPSANQAENRHPVDRLHVLGGRREHPLTRALPIRSVAAPTH